MRPHRKTVNAWPAAEWSTGRWHPSENVWSAMSRRERARQTGEYRSAIPASIAQLGYPPAREVSAAAEDAATEIARFDAESGTEMAPFAAILLRSEAAASSRIENLTASARTIALAELGDTSRTNARLIVANTSAMQAAVRLSGGISADAILRMHATLMADDDPDRAGRWRDELVWIGRSSFGPVDAEYVAPQADLVAPAIADLLRYIDRRDVPVIEQAAIAHAQFETIHPFTDGNGRTGRAVLHAMLRAAGLVRNTTVPISSGLLGDIDGYHAALTAYRAGDPDRIIELTAEAAFRAIGNGRRLVADIRGIQAQWQERVTVRSDSAVWPIMELLARRPVINTSVLHAELGIGANHVTRYMDRLLEAGVVTRMSGPTRGSYWKADAVLRALDGFAARRGRRR